MSDRMSLQHAQDVAAGYGAYMVNEIRAARTIVALHEQVERQAAQIERVREVLAWAEQAENRAHADWIATADTHHRDAALAYTQAVTWLRYALGENDD